MKTCPILMMGVVLWMALAMAQDIGPGGEGCSDNDTNMQTFMDKVKADKKLLAASNMDLNNIRISDLC